MNKLRRKVYMTAGCNTVSMGSGRKEFHPKKPRPGLDDYIRWIIKTINRLAAALIIAAIFLGSALILRSPTGPQWLGIPAFAFIGLVVSGVLGIWFFIALIRSGAL